MKFRLPVLWISVLFLLLSVVAFGQSSVEVGVGIRGGLLANKSFEEGQLCSGAGCLFGTRGFTADGLHGTVGPAVNVLFNDHLEVRFEAVHRRVGYQVRNDLVVQPILDQHILESTVGHMWEYPLLVTYHFSSGPIRPYAGGGFSVTTTGTTRTETQITSTMNQGGVTTITVFKNTAPLPSQTPFYLVAGIDGRVSHVSIRPEFRYSHFSNSSFSQNAAAILKSNQFEVLLGVSLQFRVKK